MTDPNIELEFSKFQTIAEKNYKIAKKKYEAIEATLQKFERQVKIASSSQNRGQPAQNMQTSALVSRQNAEIKALRKNVASIRANVDALYVTSKDFSIIIYGRKMSGKSTLMEILTHGDGATIGKGAQRTISDLRTYYWSGLKITDVSGFDFSNGGANDKIGINAIKTADLILFLVTNDALNEEEAEIFAHLKNYGKPILAVVNVRKILNFKRRDLIAQDLQKILSNSKEIETAIANFKNFAQNYNQDWSDIQFVTTHLLAAFYARMDKINDEEIDQASNFVEVENIILEKIITDGEFLHTKNFMDSVAIPLNKIFTKLFRHSGNSFKESKIWLEKSEKFAAELKKFKESSQNRIIHFFNALSDNIRQEVPKFVEENYINGDLNSLWNEQIQKLGYVELLQNLLRDFAEESTDEIQKTINDFVQELENSLDGRTQTNLEIEDARHFGDFYSVDLPDISKFIPKRWVDSSAPEDAGALFYQAFFDKKSSQNVTQETVTKQLIEKNLNTFEKINNKVIREILNNQILPKMDEFTKLITGYVSMLSRLGEFQSEVAETLLGEYEEITEKFVAAAVDHKNNGEIAGVKVTMRIPGKAVAVIADNSTVDADKFYALTGEKFQAIKPLKSWNDTMKEMLGCEFELDDYVLDAKNNEIAYSVTPKEKLSDEKIKLAQQISPYPIINL